MTLYRSLSDLDENTFNRAKGEIRPDETFVLGASAAEAEIGRFRTRFLITDKRVLMMKRGFIRTKTRSMPLSAITNIATSETSMLKLRIDAMGDISGEFLFPLADGKQLARAIREQIAEDETVEVA